MKFYVGHVLVWRKSGNPCKVVHVEGGLVTIRDQAGYYCAPKNLYRRMMREQTKREVGQR